MRLFVRWRDEFASLCPSAPRSGLGQAQPLPYTGRLALSCMVGATLAVALRPPVALIPCPRPGDAGAELLVPQHFKGTHAHGSIGHQGRRDHRQERGTCGQYDDHPPADAKTGIEEELPQRDHR